MILIQHHFDSTLENLALEELLLRFCEQGVQESSLHFWESKSHAVVLGYGNKVNKEVQVQRCDSDGISIFRRSSGGGCVLQGPGCLNYSLVLSLAEFPQLNQIQNTNIYVMTQMQRALALLGVDIRGCSDLVLRATHKKFSGNAQKRLSKALLFHGTFLYDFDLSLIPTYLSHPSKEPDYRQGRSHLDFVQNIPLSGEEICKLVQNTWPISRSIEISKQESLSKNISDGLPVLIEKYMQEAWNRRF